MVDVRTRKGRGGPQSDASGNFSQYKPSARGLPKTAKPVQSCPMRSTTARGGNLLAEEDGMIARTWFGLADAAQADDYQRHFTSGAVPHLKEIPGFQGAQLLRRETGGQIEFLAITFWDSIETIKAFSGPDPNTAIVEPEGRAALTTFDDFAKHYEVAYNTDPGA
jgi:heme-degrading monooxygenase HmoA